MIVVLMGVSGSGKSTVGAALAVALGWPLVDADDLHPPENVAKMAAGIPLTDDDRWPWLDRVVAELRRMTADGTNVILACSALKRAYRDRLRAAAPRLQLVFLDGDRELLASRMAARPGHFMPTSLLDSQLATLERPEPDEHALTADIARPAGEIVTALAERMTSA